MFRPYIICHMLMSIDGKVTGDFLAHSDISAATELYFKLHREFNADGFICGRVTMNESFVHNHEIDLSKYDKQYVEKEDFISDNNAKFYAVSFDRFGKLHWPSSHISDEDEGYDKSHVIEVLTKKVDYKFLSYLKEIGVSYIFAGEEDIDINIALFKLNKFFGIKKLLLEGGSIINGVFNKNNVIDELSLVVVPLCGQTNDKSLFYQSDINSYELIKIEKYDKCLYLSYKRR